jgi:hypothetical protein
MKRAAILHGFGLRRSRRGGYTPESRIMHSPRMALAAYQRHNPQWVYAPDASWTVGTGEHRSAAGGAVGRYLQVVLTVTSCTVTVPFAFAVMCARTCS